MSGGISSSQKYIPIEASGSQVYWHMLKSLEISWMSWVKLRASSCSNCREQFLAEASRSSMTRSSMASSMILFESKYPKKVKTEYSQVFAIFLEVR